MSRRPSSARFQVLFGCLTLAMAASASAAPPPLESVADFKQRFCKQLDERAASLQSALDAAAAEPSPFVALPALAAVAKDADRAADEAEALLEARQKEYDQIFRDNPGDYPDRFQREYRELALGSFRTSVEARAAAAEKTRDLPVPYDGIAGLNMYRRDRPLCDWPGSQQALEKVRADANGTPRPSVRDFQSQYNAGQLAKGQVISFEGVATSVTGDTVVFRQDRTSGITGNCRETDKIASVSPGGTVQYKVVCENLGSTTDVISVTAKRISTSLPDPKSRFAVAVKKGDRVTLVAEIVSAKSKRGRDGLNSSYELKPMVVRAIDRDGARIYKF